MHVAGVGSNHWPLDAITNCCPSPGLLHHSDCGSQCAVHGCRRVLDQHGPPRHRRPQPVFTETGMVNFGVFQFAHNAHAHGRGKALLGALQGNRSCPFRHCPSSSLREALATRQSRATRRNMGPCGPGLPRRSRLAMTGPLRREAGWAKCDCPATCSLPARLRDELRAVPESGKSRSATGTAKKYQCCAAKRVAAWFHTE